MIKPIVSSLNRHRDFILNMDQTPVHFAMPSSCTLAKKGLKTVNIQVNKKDSQRVTVEITLTASGKTSKSLVIFKGKKKEGLQSRFLGFRHAQNMRARKRPGWTRI